MKTKTKNYFQIGYYRLPIEERINSQDHIPELDFDTDFDRCLDRLKEFRARGYYNISLDQCEEGLCVESIRIESYIDEWEVA
tara:strand:- start:125 stop:370 length:246 start_codon:yes stop_codon:yes gene_type:complete